MFRFSLYVMLSCFSFPALASPVGAPEGFPAAFVNPSGDVLMAGDRKISVEWDGRRAAFAFRPSLSASELFSGGIAHREKLVAGNPAAIVCSQHQAFRFVALRDAAHPGGEWTLIKDIPSSGKSARLDCAMSENGSFVVVDWANNIAFASDGTRFSLPFSDVSARVVAVGGRFLVLGKGKAAWLQEGKVGAVLQNPFSAWTENSRVAGNRTEIVKIDGDALERVRVNLSADLSQPLKAERLPVSPCGDKEVCGVGVAADGTWTVAGFWGVYLGRGTRFVRLSVPNFAREDFGVAIAHQGNGGRFVFLGNDDGEDGRLPLLPEDPNGKWEKAFSRAGQPEKGKRWVVWLKGPAPENPAWQRLFPWKVTPRAAQGGTVALFAGVLPEDIPSDWAAWEPEISYDAIERAPNTAFFEGDDEPWWASALGRDAAWRAAEKSGIRPASIKIGVVDTGLTTNRKWFASSLATKATEIPGNGLDDDGNGYVDDVSGYDFVEEDADPQDEFGHGTHVAGLAVSADPASGRARGLAANGQLVIVRALDRYGKSNSIDLARAVRYATDENVDVLNCSWGGGPSTQVLRDAFSYAHERNVFLFSSAGNDGLDTDKNPQVPKMYPGVHAIAAVREDGRLAKFSSHGAKSVFAAAPGEKIISTVMDGGLGEKSGTSMASPLAAGAVAWLLGVVRAQFPEMSRPERNALVEKALCHSADPRGIEGNSQCGKIHLGRALSELLTRISSAGALPRNSGA